MNSNNKIALYLVPILIITLLAFLPSLQNGFTNWDDDVYVTQNLAVQSPNDYGIAYFFTQAQASNYHPLTMLSLALDYQVWGNNAFGFHLNNLILHLLNTVLVFFFAYQLAQKRIWVAVVTGLLFGIHPLHVESVAWISERKDVLYVFFFLLGLLSYLQFLRKNAHFKWYGAAFLLFLLSLLSKPAAVVFPLVLFLIDWYEQRAFTVKNSLLKVPFLLCSVIFGIATVQIQKQEAIATLFSWGQKICFAGYGFVMYLVKMLVPSSLSPLYIYPVNNATQALPTWYFALPIVALLIVVGLLFLGQKKRFITFGLLFFILNIALVLQVIAVGNAVMADRYTYLSLVGMFFIFGMFFDALMQQQKLKNLALGALAMLTLVFGVLTFKQNKIWKDSTTLWTQAIKADNKNTLAYNKRGLAYMENAATAQKALEDFNKSIALEPTYDQAWGNRGYLYFKANDFVKAEADFTKAIALNPNYFKHYNNRGHLYYKQEKLDAALADYNRCIELKNDYALVFNNRAIIYHQQGEKQKALADYDRALALNPQYASAQKNKALLLNEQ